VYCIKNNITKDQLDNLIAKDLQVSQEIIDYILSSPGSLVQMGREKLPHAYLKRLGIA
jgi:hypothetical protein